MRGEPFVYPTAERSLLGRALDRRASRGVVLTGRESQILALIADGHTSREIAEMLVISPRTVERHRENLRHKLGPAKPGRPDPLRDPGRPHRAVTS